MVAATIGWNHPTDESDQWDGFNEPGMEHFTGSPIQHLAREVNQNSLDAGEDGIVEVRIELREVKVSEIPNLDELKANFKCCYEASDKESKKATTFFQAALAELEKPKIAVLEISDHNTRGHICPADFTAESFGYRQGRPKNAVARRTRVYRVEFFQTY